MGEVDDERCENAGDDDDDDDRPESDGINLQCVNSSDFIVGKQTTFNGPVTIINCTDGGEDDDKFKTTTTKAEAAAAKDEIVIREKVISVSGVKAFADTANDAALPSADETKTKSDKGSLIRSILHESIFKLPIVAWVLFGIVLAVVGLVVTLQNRRDDTVPLTTAGSSDDVISLPYNGSVYALYGRQSWGAKPPLSRIELRTPVPYVVISHAASRFCYDKQSCMVLVRDIQAGSMNGGTSEPDLKYNFMVGGDGNVYEGRGWRVQNPTTGFAAGKSVDINFLGSFQSFDPPTYPQIEAVKALIDYGVNNSYIAEDYALISANATKPTLSPGLQVYSIIKDWPHFDPDPRSRASGKRDR